MNHTQLRTRVLILAFVSLFFLTQCGPGTVVQEEPAKEPVVENPPEFAEVSVTASVQRLATVAWAGDIAPLPTLGSAGKGLKPGGMVTTDASGVARISIKNCLSIYVFQFSNHLVDAACNRQQYSGQNGGCLVSGMSAYNVSCSSAVQIETASASLTSGGTWFAVAYIDELQLSLILALDDAVIVRPLRLLNEEPLEPIRLEPGSFLFTTPGDAPVQIAGLNGREPIPFAKFPQLRERLLPLLPQLDLWLETLNLRAEEDRIVVPPFLEVREPGLYVNTAGEFFDDERIQLALRTIAPWQDFRLRYFDDPDFNLLLVTPGGLFTDFQRVNYDPEQTNALLQAFNDETGKLDSQLFLLVPTDDDRIQSLGKEIFSFLVENSLTVEIVNASPRELPLLLEEILTAGESAIWLELIR